MLEPPAADPFAASEPAESLAASGASTFAESLSDDALPSPKPPAPPAVGFEPLGGPEADPFEDPAADPPRVPRVVETPADVAAAALAEAASAVAETPTAAAPAVLPETSSMPPAATASGPAGGVAASVGRTAGDVQDYEDDLFAEAPAEAAGQTLRSVLGSKSIASAMILLVLGGGAYTLRGSIAELLGFATPGAASSRASSAGHSPAGQAPPERSGSALGPAAGSGAVEVDNGKVGEVSKEQREASMIRADRPIEEVDVSEDLPPGTDVSADPAADPTVTPRTGAAQIDPLDPIRVGSPATRIVDISWRRTDGGTQVTLRMDGSLRDDRYSHHLLEYNQAREMVKIKAISEPYVSNRLAVGSQELQQIRIGFHDNNEIHVVFDFPAAGPHIADVRSSGDRVEVLVVR